MSREGHPLKVVQVIPLFLATFFWISAPTDAAVAAQEVSSSNCSGYATCGQCIAASCQWCQQENFTAVASGGTSRCQSTVDALLANGCARDAILRRNVTLTYHNDTPPQDTPDDTSEAIQLSPQNITIRVSLNRPFTFPVTFRLAANFPGDLYFLMDASKTMEHFKKALISVSETLVASLGKITRNCRLGFGTYVDKVTFPFCATVIYPGYEAPFTYRHLVSLTRDVATFRDRVNATLFATNVDIPEDVFDALVQVTSVGYGRDLFCFSLLRDEAEGKAY